MARSGADLTIASAGQLGVVGVMLIANLVWARIRQNLGRKTLVVLDEGWTMLVARTVVVRQLTRADWARSTSP